MPQPFRGIEQAIRRDKLSVYWTRSTVAMETYFCSRLQKAIHSRKGGRMKIVSYCSVFVFLTLLSFPITAQAMGSRHHSWELAQNQSAPHNSNTHTHDGAGHNTLENGGATNVPEPSSFLLVGLGIGFLAICSINKRFRGQDACREKAR